jgi:hypothetical protein
MQEIADPGFILACRDYFYLVDRNYPEKGTLKLVGDRYRLSGDQRTILYRGISSSEKSLRRKSKLVKWNGNGSQLLIDGYNVIFTMLNYRLGRAMFISTDTILRDAGSLHGRIKDDSFFMDCAGMLLRYLATNPPACVRLFFDSPVSHSERHAAEISGIMDMLSIKGSCSVVRSADHMLKQFTEGIISTSDTAIIDNSALPVTDLPRQVLEDAFRPVFPDLGEYL